MGKRSNFDRVEKDFYPTFDDRAYPPLFQMIPKGIAFRYYEPCSGEMDMVNKLSELSSFRCVGYSDIKDGKNVFDLDKEDLNNADCIITNPPWSRHVLHPMISKFMSLGKMTYLLIDSGWSNNESSSPYLEKWCTGIIPIGRLTFMRDTDQTGKDDCSWYRFSPVKEEHQTIEFFPRIDKRKKKEFDK